ncbi:MAG: DUF4089 domain-containing protein [Burkholderiales bacterium]
MLKMPATPATVDALAALVGLKIPPQYRVSVQLSFDRLAQAAALVMSFPLDRDVEPATVYNNDRR